MATAEGSNLRLNLRDQQDDNFKIRQESSGVISITARGQTQTFTGFTKIIGYAGAGNDSIVFDDSVTINAEIYGGSGNDTLTYRGTGRATFYGETGDDNPPVQPTRTS